MNNKFPFHVLDDLLNGFTHDDLITAVLSNESVITEQTIKKVFNEMLLDLHRNKWISEYQ